MFGVRSFAGLMQPRGWVTVEAKRDACSAVTTLSQCESPTVREGAGLLSSALDLARGVGLPPSRKGASNLLRICRKLWSLFARRAHKHKQKQCIEFHGVHSMGVRLRIPAV